MEVTHSHCAGLDVHKKTVVACCLSPGEGGELVKETRTFSTMTQDLLNLGDWLLHKGITHVALGSTGEYWKPVYNLLEDGFTVLVVNAQHIAQTPPIEPLTSHRPPAPPQGYAAPSPVLGKGYFPVGYNPWSGAANRRVVIGRNRFRYEPILKWGSLS